jgi:hypothetical protein
MRDRKVEIMYFYSDLYENRKGLSGLSKKLRQKRKDISIRLVNVEDPENEELTELYKVNMVPVMVFLTLNGEVAARRSVPLSAEKIIEDVADRINKGELPNPAVEEIRAKILESFRSATKRDELTQLVAEQFENDLMGAGPESEIYERVNHHISAINHTIHDLEALKRVLQKFSKNQHDFVV